MNLQEANARLKNKINQDQLWSLNSLCILLDLDKDDVCKVADAVGVEKLIDRQVLYDKYFIAISDYEKRQKAERIKARLHEIETGLMELESEKKELEAWYSAYAEAHNI